MDRTSGLNSVKRFVISIRCFTANRERYAGTRKQVSLVCGVDKAPAPIGAIVLSADFDNVIFVHDYSADPIVLRRMWGSVQSGVQHDLNVMLLDQFAHDREGC